MKCIEIVLIKNKKLITLNKNLDLPAFLCSSLQMETYKRIKENVKKALSQNLENSIPVLPRKFELEICYKDHTKAERNSYFPGVEKINDNTIVFKTEDYYELLRTFFFIN